MGWGAEGFGSPPRVLIRLPNVAHDRRLSDDATSIVEAMMEFRVESVEVSEDVLHVVAPCAFPTDDEEPLRFFVPKEAYEPEQGGRLECETHARAEDAPVDAECTLSGVVVEATGGWLLVSHGGLAMRLPRRLAPQFKVGDPISASMWTPRRGDVGGEGVCV